MLLQRNHFYQGHQWSHLPNSMLGFLFLSYVTSHHHLTQLPISSMKWLLLVAAVAARCLGFSPCLLTSPVTPSQSPWMALLLNISMFQGSNLGLFAFFNYIHSQAYGFCYLYAEDSPIYYMLLWLLPRFLYPITPQHLDCTYNMHLQYNMVKTEFLFPPCLPSLSCLKPFFWTSHCS